MNKKAKNIKEDINISKSYSSAYDENITNANIATFCKGLMEIFGANNNILRHTPFVEDGLKPGARRMLYAIYSLGVRHTGKHVKVSKLVAQTMLFHPHGDIPIYNTLVKLAQPWQNTVTLIKGDGNFGSPQGAKAGAPRYIEAKLSEYTMKCFFEDFDKDAVIMMDNYSQDLKEPETLPSRYPNILINSSFGIGYGVFCGIPPFNIKEVCELVIKLLRNPEHKNVVLIPDIPTGAIVVDNGEFKEFCETGKGKYRSRGIVEKIDNELIIKGTPFSITSDKVKKQIVKLFDQGFLPGMVKLNDDSNKKNGIKVRLIFKKEIDLNEVEALLYRKTDLEYTHSCSLSVIDDYEYNYTNLRSIILDWIDYRREYIRKLYNRKFIRVNEEKHLLEILMLLTEPDNIHDTIDIVMKSRNKVDTSAKLMERFGITSMQADKVSSLRVSTFNEESREEYIRRYNEIDDEIANYKYIIVSNTVIDDMIQDDLKECIKLFGTERKSKIITDKEARNVTEHSVVVTEQGYIKKYTDTVTDFGTLNSGDVPVSFNRVSSEDSLLLFDANGMLTKVPIDSLLTTELDSIGTKVVKSKVRAVLVRPNDQKMAKLNHGEASLIMITRNGFIKKTPIVNYLASRSELIAINIKADDELVSVLPIVEDTDIIIYTSNGMGVRVNTSEIKSTNRNSIGVRALMLEDGDTIEGASKVIRGAKHMLIVTTKGNIKKCLLSAFGKMDLKSKPLKVITLLDGETVKDIKTCNKETTMIAYLSDDKKVIELADVPELPRLSKGKKMVPVKRGDNIAGIKIISK